MVFSLLTGVVKTAVDFVDDFAEDIDDALFGGDGTSDRKRREMLSYAQKCRAAGMTDTEIEIALEIRYGQ